MATLTVEDVIAAYEKTGLNPRQGDSRIKNNACCGVGALYRASGRESDDGREMTTWFHETYGDADAFIEGFDGIKDGYAKKCDFYNVGREAAIRLGLIKTN